MTYPGLPTLCCRRILVPRTYDPSGLRQESRALGATISGMRIDADCVKTDGQNTVISFVISKWLLPELSIRVANQKDRRLWGQECCRRRRELSGFGGVVKVVSDLSGS